MDMQLMNKGLDLTLRKRKWVFILSALGFTGYGVFRVYNSPSFVRKKNRVFKLLRTLISIAELVSDSGEILGILSRDLRVFLQSDSDEIPNSLKQICKIYQSKEFSDSVFRISLGFTRGVLRGCQGEVESGKESSSGFHDRFMDKLFSNAGSGFASVVVGSFARSLVMALFSSEDLNARVDLGTKKVNVEGSVSSDASLSRWVDVICDDRVRELIGELIEKFVRKAIAVYLDRTMNINTCDEFFAGLTNPRHEKQVRDLLVSVCSVSIETFVKTSHQVLTSSSSDAKLCSDSSDISRFVVRRSDSDVVSKTIYPPINDAHNVITVNHNRHEKGLLLDIREDRRSSSEGKSGQSSGWISTMSSTLAVPSNRKFVLDVNGRVTSETVRSFLEFLLEKVSAGVKTGAHVANEATVDRGLQVVRYMTSEASVVATICLSLCLHVLGDTQTLIPA